MSNTVIVTVVMPVEEYMSRGPAYAAAEIMAAEHGGRWLGSGTDMTTNMSDVDYIVPDEGAATALIDALKGVGLAGKVVRI